MHRSVCIHACVGIPCIKYLYICVHMYEYMCMPIGVLCVCMPAYMYKYIYACMYMFECMCIYDVLICVRMYVCL